MSWSLGVVARFDGVRIVSIAAAQQPQRQTQCGLVLDAIVGQGAASTAQNPPGVCEALHVGWHALEVGNQLLGGVNKIIGVQLVQHQRSAWIDT